MIRNDDMQHIFTEQIRSDRWQISGLKASCQSPIAAEPATARRLNKGRRRFQGQLRQIGNSGSFGPKSSKHISSLMVEPGWWCSVRFVMLILVACRACPSAEASSRAGRAARLPLCAPIRRWQRLGCARRVLFQPRNTPIRRWQRSGHAPLEAQNAPNAVHQALPLHTHAFGSFQSRCPVLVGLAILTQSVGHPFHQVIFEHLQRFATTFFQTHQTHFP